MSLLRCNTACTLKARVSLLNPKSPGSFLWELLLVVSILFSKSRAFSQHDMNKLSQAGEENNLPRLRTTGKTLPYKNLRLTILKKDDEMSGRLCYVKKCV